VEFRIGLFVVFRICNGYGFFCGFQVGELKVAERTVDHAVVPKVTLDKRVRVSSDRYESSADAAAGHKSGTAI
jgi:hypothetical protein